MGLATAQARLLTITARKSDCEFLSMSYSHQKIALSRNMEKVSTEYQNALNQTKLEVTPTYKVVLFLFVIMYIYPCFSINSFSFKL